MSKRDMTRLEFVAWRDAVLQNEWWENHEDGENDDDG